MNRYVQEIAAVGQRLARQGLVTAHAGNISRRLVGRYIITTSGVRKDDLDKNDVLFMDYHGHPLIGHDSAKEPSSENGLHLALYQAYPQIEAIVHAHPPYATALASAGKELDWQLLEEGRLFLGPVPLLEYFPAGSAELAQAAAQAANGANALLLAGHGALSWGANLEEALCRMEIVEHICRVMLYKQLFQG